MGSMNAAWKFSCLLYITFVVNTFCQDCDFETGLCGYTQSTTDTFDWTRLSGSTDTSGTGPKSDHTSTTPNFKIYTKEGNANGSACVFPFKYLGTMRSTCVRTLGYTWCATTSNYDQDSLWGKCLPAGFYMFIETSSPRKAGDKAVLLSPTISSGPNCLKFWYHMYGPHIDTLNVYAASTNGSLGAAVWSKTGTQGDIWLAANVTLVKTDPIKIAFEGIRGSDFRGDIAIDDIKVEKGSCDADPNGICTFENDTCGFMDDQTANFNWTRSKGATPSALTGPSVDHTLGTAEGYYMYVEASNTRAGQMGRLSKRYDGLPSSGSCLTFWYHMFGINTGQLNIYVNPPVIGAMVPAWRMQGQQGDLWLQGQVSLNTSSALVVIEGVTAWGYLGDMAIDDISVSPTPCLISGECTFQAGLCTWYNLPALSREDEFDWIIGQGQSPTSFTGPSADRTGNAAGKYLFIETSSPRVPGDRARLMSPVFNTTKTGGSCFMFFYHMFGQSIGRLNIYARSNGTETLLWRLVGDKGDKWYNGQVNVARSAAAYEIIIEGIRGDSYTGDIAVDDFTFKDGDCAIVPQDADPATPLTTVAPTTVAALTTPKSAGTIKCDFESGLCTSWSQDQATDQLDWTWARGATASAGTGPSVDHTRGDQFGGYMYLETSLAPSNITRVARLISNIQSATGDSQQCFSFWYHMYGPDINTLSIYVMVHGQAGTPVWTRTGTQGNQWIQGNAQILARDNFNIVVEASAGKSYQGDIAIDDVELRFARCPATAGLCTFDEDDTICGYSHDTSSNVQFQWRRASKATDSLGTGPTEDHTQQSRTGYYMYTEASGRKRGDKARLISPVYSPTASRCLEFWYHMYGADMGTLGVYMLAGTTLGTTPLWSESGDKGDSWKIARVTLKSSVDYQMVFEGVIGGSYLSDIAIDDIKVIDGPCPPPGACSFEFGLCTWSNVKGLDNFDWIRGSAGTPSLFTGPKVDHTTGTANGSYMFIESSSPRKRGDVAYLVSEQFNAVGGKTHCIEFWYHMYGADIGELSVVYKVYSGSQLETPIWNLTGQQQTSEDDPWRYARAPVDMDADHIVMFIGKVYGAFGDIAIDDVSFSNLACAISPPEANPNGKATPAPTTPYPTALPPTIPPSPLNCDFEVDFCSLTQDASGHFNFSRKQGRTDSLGTGPTVDHTRGAGAVGKLGPGSIMHTSGKCLHVLNGAWDKPADDQPLVLYTGCGEDRMEFKLDADGTLRYTKWNMCVRPKLQQSGTTVGVASSCTDKWSLLPNGALQHVGTKLCLSPFNGWENPPDNANAVLYARCDLTSRQFTFVPTTGWYAFIEASYPRLPNDTARLTSPAIAKSGQCLTFWYHMYGAHVNRLNVYLKYEGKLGTPVWSMVGTHGDRWIMATVQMNSQVPYQYVFEAIRGDDYQGDIAIDDVSVADADCPTSAYCNFEQANDPYCGWTNLKSDEFDWQVASGSTATDGTGPKSDHTFANDVGKYLYIETSGLLQPGWKAKIQSKVYPANTKFSGGCFQFWYHMYGSSIGSLNLYLNQGNSPSSTPTWSRTGEQGDQWLIGQITITSTTPFTLTFEGVRGASYTGDIAVDDLNMLPGVCNSPATCDFENDRCTWTNTDREDTFDWSLGQGGTPSVWTGPLVDHSKETGEGRYMFIEASPPRKLGDKARLVSEMLGRQFWPAGTYCLKFWYHMRGSDIGTLNLFIKSGPGNTSSAETLLWSLSGNQGQSWMEGTAPISSRVPYQMVFEALHGGGAAGDIALDDINYFFTYRDCPLQPNAANPTLNPTTRPPTILPTTLPVGVRYDCDFEKDTCSWTDDLTANFNWTRHQGKTSTIDSGPSTDHTLKTLSGYYLYIEASYPRQDGDVARLISPVIKGDRSAGGHCFSLWFHMYGPNIDKLTVYQKFGGNMKAVWRRIGNNGNVWRSGQIDVNSDLDYQIVIEGTRGNGYNGDIAIDDLNLEVGACPPQVMCDFEHGMCGYTNDATADYDWSRHTGATASLGTGPSQDHTLLTSQGYYVYAEASGRRKNGDKARLIGPVLTNTDAMCLQFWYHLYGAQIGDLNVYIQTPVDGRTMIWKKSGNHMDQWNIGRVTLGPRAGRQVIFEAVRGIGFQGDIALDDIFLMPGNCPPPGNCNFEGDDGMCTWTNVFDKSDTFDWILGQGNTTSFLTGPSVDHTTGTAGGTYAFIETSAPQKPGDTAWLVSEMFPASLQRCIQFWYHMAGADIGTLNVHMRGQNNTLYRIWTLSGEQGRQGSSNVWMSGQAPLQSSVDYQVVFEGIRGGGPLGDIAIDDIAFTNFRCQNIPANSVPPDPTTVAPTTVTTTALPTPAFTQYSCNFTFDKCAWADDPTAKFSWLRHQGSTASDNTGPKTDHTTGASGWYIYIETSFPRKMNDTARLISPEIPSTSQMCLQFWYHMYGDHIGNLTVHRQQGSSLMALWTRSGTQTDRWRHALVEVSSSTKFKIIFEGIAGDGYQGDIALDDLALNDGPCPPSAECTFEDPDLCGWSNIAGDNFDWTRDNAGTSTTSTGPRVDHTYGTAAGYYMYIEASSPRTKGQKAWLISKEYSPSGEGRCLRFYYHMYGRDIGSLNVLVSQNGSRSAPIWTLSGNQGDMWMPTRVTVDSPAAYQIIFEGLIGSSFAGDIAIDDVSITEGKCPHPGNCDFEQDKCGYFTAPWRSTQFEWQLGSGTTATTWTGPTTDHSTGTKFGRYMFIESSYPRLPYDTAQIESEVIPVSGAGKCATFWYHMYGADIGELNVIMQVGQQSFTSVWSMKGDQGDKWLQGQAPLLSRQQTMQIIFQGIRGGGYKGDIAIDDIVIVDYTGACPVLPANAVPFGCNFEQNICNWVQLKDDDFDWTRNKGLTGSIGTGPSVDHTTNTSMGYYLYIETSYPRNPNDTARIISPSIFAPSNGTRLTYCLFFTYHMYGPHVDRLKVYTKANYKYGPVLWYRNGSAGPEWQHQELQINIADPTQIVIEATRGSDFKGDIAIDDIDLTYGDCIFSGICTFESAQICGWYNPQNKDGLQWARGSGATTSADTGPTYDRTYQTSFGHYMYLETSNQAPKGSTAMLYSPWYMSSGQMCFLFYYHMYGDQIGSLTVSISYGSLVFSGFKMSGNQNDTWYQGQATVSRAGWFRVLVAGTKGDGYRGDIAIDDTRLREGQCPPPGYCDFEDIDTCTWTQRSDDDFDWMIGQGATKSSFTGPSIDHTTGTDRGYYAFIESSAPQKRGDKASMQSMRFSPTVGQGSCFSFWYHMFGASTGTLNVYLSSLVGVTVLTKELMWQMKGNQGDKWSAARIPVVSANDYEFVLEAIVGTGFTSDIAIDDLKFDSGACAFTPKDAWPPGKTTPPPTDAPTTVGPTTGNTGNDCNFEAGICPAYSTNMTSTRFQWLRHQGATSSAGTGPNADHTTQSDKGYYVYVESSYPAMANDTAWLLTTVSNNPNGFCLSFWFHMYGPHVGSLNVWNMQNSAAVTQWLWTRTGTQGDDWRHGQVAFKKSTEPVTIVFEAIRGNGFQGDIALDDISFTVGDCPAARECDFEASAPNDPFCGWVQDPDVKDDFDWSIGSGNTPSVLTGPSTDHTLQTNEGHYLYIEASFPRKQGDAARLLSKPFDKTNGQCFSFWYHMYGLQVGNLTLSMRVKGTDTNLWFKSANQGNVWYLGLVNLKSTDPFQLAFEARVGSGYSSDIAIDDILVVDDTCPKPGDCTFEEFGVCTYMQESKEDDIDWLRGSGSTSSWRTGPSIDNTKKSKAGRYMFIEASAPAQPGQKARLVSELFGATSTNGRCLQFYRHMFGAHIGTLNVYAKYASGNTSDAETLVWSSSGNQGDSWIQSQAPIISSRPFRIVFEAIRGDGYQGDIALDDISFNNNFFPCSFIPAGSQPPTLPPTTITPADSNCTFDNGLCRWEQSKTDDFDWTLKKGATDSLGTGPLGDHTSGTGQYIYIEASFPRKPNQTASLLSPKIRPTGLYSCFSFWYHMHGAHINQLNVYRLEGTTRTMIWSREGTQGNQWRQAQVRLKSNYVIFRLEMEGVRGVDYEGDISLDDVVVTDKACDPPPYCDFEDGMCEWNNVGFGDDFNWLRHNGGTPSLGTGPSTDHTTGTAQGNYMYIETSAPRKNGDKAWMYSQLYPASISGKCFNFWYHMSGYSIGALNIYLGSPRQGAAIWQRSGDQGNLWYHGRVTVKSGASFRVYVEGVCGISYFGDIAIDDVWIEDEPCPSPGSCDFEDQSFCTWTQVPNTKTNVTNKGFDNFDWELGSGSTPSWGTGPTVDHTLGTALGTYAFIETSGMRKQGQIARLESETFPNTTGQCLSFWMHMYGSDVGSLNFYMSNAKGEFKIKSMSGNMGNKWLPEEVTLVSPTSYKVIIEATQGTGWAGDISIDDILIKDGNCVGLCSSIKPAARIACGPASVTAGSCVATYGCCYDDTVPNMPKCFYHPGTCQAVHPTLRSQCGFAGISQSACVKQGCCYDDTIQTGLKCYNYLSVPTDHPPTLPPPTTPPPSKYDCTFEQDQCGYVNTTDDQNDWTRDNGGTASWGTGPSFDHTLGNDKGYYMYMEVTGFNENSTANLETPLIQFLTGGARVCVHFYYHMYGSHVGTLNVFKKVPTLANEMTLLWTKSGTRPDAWQYAQITVDRMPDFKIVFQGVRGSGYQGDIAIDDVGFVNGACPPDLFCGFENGDFCGFTQDASDDFDWTLGKEQTSSWETGPSNDTTYGTKYGNYIFLEASYPRVAGDKCRLESYENPPTTGVCVEFMYHMYGADMGTLNVYMRRGGRLDKQPVWTLSGDQGNEWYRAQIDVVEQQNWKFMFEGIRGGGYTSDIALDDVHLHEGACIPQGDCTFNLGHACGYSNDPQNQVDWIIYAGPTPSHNTGPSTDHTTGTKYGRYLYIEASSPAKKGDIGRMVSEKFKVNPNFKWCVNFYYHMFGNGIGALRVRTRYNAKIGTTRYTYYKTWWTEQGNHDDQWLPGSVNITSNYDFQIVFEAEIGSGVSYESDVAIDDIVVTQGVCDSPGPPPTPSPCLRKCKDGTCVPGNKVCDFVPDCAQRGDSTDTTDEDGCDGCDFESEVLESCEYKTGDGVGGVELNIGTVKDAQTCAQMCYDRSKTNSSINGATVDSATGTNCYCEFDMKSSNNVAVWKTCFFKTSGGLCGWQTNSKGLFDWRRQQGRTATVNTGPSVDHTKGNALGYYVYVEASNGKSQDLARLDSPTLSQASSTCRLEFWYHMYGSSIGTLNVYIKLLFTLTRLWTLSGNQGDRWQKGVVYIMRRQAPYTIRFEAIRSYSFTGDIAIDDIKLSDCALPAPATMCLTSWFFRCGRTRACVNYDRMCDFTDDCGDNTDEENCRFIDYPYRCDFENSLCSWANLKDDDFDWTRDKGMTDSSGTGPMFDHTLGTSSGSYIYTEVSYPRKPNDKARLGGPVFEGRSGQSCFMRFYYHMLGDDIGRLSIRYRLCRTCAETEVWWRNGTVGNFWVRHMVAFRVTEPFEVVIQAEHASGYQGDIALDDISFYSCTQYRGVFPTAIPTTTRAPTTTPCTTGSFYCVKDNNCIPSSKVCDFRQDCTDGQDEVRCGPCNFENDMCGYTDISDKSKYEFQRMQPQASNGPKKDNSGNSTGFFAITGSGSGTINTLARMESPPLTPTGAYCVVQFSYYYNSSGNAFIRMSHQQGKTESLIFVKTQTSKDGWETRQIGVGSRPGGWTIKLSASPQYVAYDDIQFINCSLPVNRGGACPRTMMACDSGACITPEQLCDYSDDCGDRSDEKDAVCQSYTERCDFEADTCNWYQAADDDMDWYRIQGRTSSEDTGPGSDHTTGTRLGFYMYIETTGGQTNDSARLHSVVFLPQKSQMCSMRFYYHMFGNGIGALNIWMHTSIDSLSPRTLLWSKNGDQGNIWRQASIPISSDVNYQIVIEGTRGPNYMGDISIDDVSFTPDCKPDVRATLSPDVLTISPPPGCMSGEWSCGDGKCIPAYKLCNFVPDCANKMDEASCPPSCDFEQGTCAWKNNRFSDVMDWTRHQGQTPSNGTGPNADHTTGTGLGYYMYMEAGQLKFTRFPNAQLMSPMFKRGSYNCKFSFWYNMYHFQVGSDVQLNVLYLRNSKETVLWSSSQGTGDQWVQGNITLPNCPTDFQVVFEGRHYWGTKTDAAIDDVAFDCAEPTPPAKCADNEFRCSQTQQCIPAATLCDIDRNCCDGSDEASDLCSQYVRQDFESGLGGWVQLRNDDFDFTFTSGATSSTGTGPTRDHTLQEEHGNYVFIEASSPRKENETARLASPTIAGAARQKRESAPGGCVMRFWYHMLGVNIGSLNVYLATTYGATDNLVFSVVGQQGNEWKRGVVALSSAQNFQVIIEGKIGSSFAGDIAVDDISFTPECRFNMAVLPGGPTLPPIDPCLPDFQCPTSLTCLPRNRVCDFVLDCPGGADEALDQCGNPLDFESGFGAWTNSFSDDYDWEINKGPTSSFGTGPATDAKGRKDGHYAYLEVSGRRKDKYASFGSPLYGQSFSDCQLDFYYHMMGRDVGSLRIDLVDGVMMEDGSPTTTLWRLAGEQGKDWIKGTTYIGRRYAPFFINITATVGGSGFQGDIAVDEIGFRGCQPAPLCSGPSPGKFMCSNGRCIDESKVCDFVDDCGDDASTDESFQMCSLYLGCNFEEDSCNFTQAKNDDFDWTRKSGMTLSDNTGPSRDHTFGTSLGNYLYIEATGRKYMDKAQLYSQKIEARPGGTCWMKLYYHMFGKHVSDLNVYVFRDGIMTLKTRLSGDYGDMWYGKVVDLSTEVGVFQVVIEGVVGQSFLSDIAIDDIIFTPDCLTNGTRGLPTVKPCGVDEFQCKSDGKCLPRAFRCNGKPNCADSSDELGCVAPTAKEQVGSLAKGTGMIAASVVGGLVVLLIVILVVYLIVKRKREKKMHLFSVFFDPTKPNPEKKSEPKDSSSKADTGVSNPVYDERPVGEFSMGELDTNMFADEAVAVRPQKRGGATSMANPLYQDPYMEDDDSPLSNF